MEEEGRRRAEEKKRREAQALSRWYQLLSSIVTRQKLNNCYRGDGSSSQMSTDIQHTKNDKQNDSSGCVSSSRPERPKVGKPDALRYVPSTMKAEHEHVHVYLEEDMSYDEESCVRTKRCHCGFSIQVEEL